MTLVPAVTPVTHPVSLTVATAGVADNQLLPAVGAEPVNCVVAPIQAVNVPLIVGSAKMVTISITGQPFPSV